MIVSSQPIFPLHLHRTNIKITAEAKFHYLCKNLVHTMCILPLLKARRVWLHQPLAIGHNHWQLQLATAQLPVGLHVCAYAPACWCDYARWLDVQANASRRIGSPAPIASSVCASSCVHATCCVCWSIRMWMPLSSRRAHNCWSVTLVLANSIPLTKHGEILSNGGRPTVVSL